MEFCRAADVATLPNKRFFLEKMGVGVKNNFPGRGTPKAHLAHRGKSWQKAFHAHMSNALKTQARTIEHQTR